MVRSPTSLSVDAKENAPSPPLARGARTFFRRLRRGGEKRWLGRAWAGSGRGDARGAGQHRRAPAVKPRQARAAKPAERLCQGWGLGLMPGCSAGSSGALANFLWRLLGQAMMSDARALGGLRFRLENTRACLASPFPGCGSGAAKISRGGAGSGWARGLGAVLSEPERDRSADRPLALCAGPRPHQDDQAVGADHRGEVLLAADG